MSEKIKQRNNHHSFFWPVIMLGAGVIWLLINLNIISADKLRVLYNLWPVLIILAGLDVLFARQLPIIGALLALLMIAGIVYLLIWGNPFAFRSTAGFQAETLMSGAWISNTVT